MNARDSFLDTLPQPEQAASVSCFHCGAPLLRVVQWSVIIDGVEQPMCCPGCQAVAQAIVDNDCTDYYRDRTALSGTIDQAALVPEALKLYDAAEALAKFASPAGGEGRLHEAVFAVEGIRCAACAWLIEKRIARVPGVKTAVMNIATERLQVCWDSERCKPSDILHAMREIGYAAYPYDAVRHGRQLERAQKALFRQTFVAGLCMMQVMMYAVPAYIAEDGTLDADMAAMMRWASLLLTLPALLYSAQPFFRGAWQSLKNRALGMDVPVALGIAAAFAGSMAATWAGRGDVYFDSVTMFIFLLLCSRYFEAGARRKAAASLEKLQHALPASAARMTDYPNQRTTETVAAAQLAEGDIVLVRPGEAFAADGVILEGETAIDVALLTGESHAQHKASGQTVPGGAVNIMQAVVIQVGKPARESTLSMLVRLIERAGQSKPQIALWADSVAAWFVAVLLLFAAAVFIYWQLIDPSRAWPIAITVLVVSCPCALSLATPTALATATDRLVGLGIVIVKPHVLETLHRATHVIFDKTGTLTHGKPVLRHTEVLADTDAITILRIAAALGMQNSHPVATAIAAAAQSEGIREGQAEAVRYVLGQGVEGIFGGERYRLGNANFVTQLTGSDMQELVSDASSAAMTSLYLGKKDQWLGRLDLSDAVRSDARALVEYFKSAGKDVMLLSGDREETVRHVADELGIDAAHGAHPPDQKLSFVHELQEKGAVVAMIGDGINDAAVLSAADVSFAMGKGAALAQIHADAVLLSDDLSSLRDAATTASRTMHVIRQNLVWATLYNLVAIPAAAAGWLNPWLSGIGMAASSALVVANALRLRRGARGAHTVLTVNSLATHG
jgi:Cu2+-exporting ATPase